jgi:hypothetical protein
MAKLAIKRYQSLSADGASQKDLDRIRELLAIVQEQIAQSAPPPAPPEGTAPALAPAPGAPQ